MAKEKKDEKADKPTPIASTYYAAHDKAGWSVHRVDVYPGPRFESSEVVKPTAMLIAADRLRVLLAGVGP